MATTSVNLRDFGVDTTGTYEAVLTARPDMRLVKLSFLAPVLVLTASIIAYLLPLAIDPDYQLAGSVVIATIGVAGFSFLLLTYEALAKAVYTVTNEHIEEEYGIIYKRLRRIPLSYVRDVTYDQNFVQRIFKVSSITVSPTNGDKIVLSNIPEGESARERIWNLMLSRSPREKRTT
jgi:membrane protein YdbS with pleckstrin-like domain